LMKDALIADVGGLDLAHRSINILLMVTLVTIASTYGKMIPGEFSCSLISICIHWLCLSSFTWCVVRPAYLAKSCSSPLPNLKTGWWLHLTATGLPLLITAAASATQMIPTHQKLCLSGPSMSFTWSAAIPALILASISMFLILYAATRLRDGFNEFQHPVQQKRTNLLWVGLLTVLLSCEWGLILLWFSSGLQSQNRTILLLLASVALFHAATNFICHCLCNIKAQQGCKSVLSAFGVREPQEKSQKAEFLWSSPGNQNRADLLHTLRPVNEGHVPDCVQMTYQGVSDASTARLYDTNPMQQYNQIGSPCEGSGTVGGMDHCGAGAPGAGCAGPPHHQFLAGDVSRPNAFGTCPPSARANMTPGANGSSEQGSMAQMSHHTTNTDSSSGGAIYPNRQLNHQNPSLPRMNRFADFRTASEDFEYRPHHNLLNHQAPHPQPHHYQYQFPNGDVEV
jgi:hypothetical protein